MTKFEVLIPRQPKDITLFVEVRSDGIAVSDASSGSVFTVREARPAPPAPPQVPAKPDIMSELFLEAGRIYEHKSAKAAAELVLVLAMKALGADSGAVYISSINRQDLHVVATYGPAAPALGVRVPMGQGTVGRAAQEGVAVTGGDGGACSPAQHEGRTYGAIYLVRGKEPFRAADLGPLDYLAGQFAEYLINTGQTDA